MLEKMNVDEGLLGSAMERATELGAKYADVRLDTAYGEGASAENGDIKDVSVGEGTSVGVRALAGGTWGFYSSDVPSAEALGGALMRCVEKAVRAAKATAGCEEIKLAPVDPAIAKVKAKIDKRPPPVEEIKKLAVDVAKEMRALEGVVMSMHTVGYDDVSRYFWSTEGAKIIQERLRVKGYVYAVAAGESGTQSVYIPYGADGGWEWIERLDPMKLGLEWADTARKLATEAAVPESGTTTVVTRPDFNSLKVHEIVGHPVEGDRILGGESAWAGRAWWQDMLGQRVGSELVNVVSDARPMEKHEGFWGTFAYDDEGVPAKRVVHIEDGVLKGFLHSRQSAAFCGEEPSGAMRTLDAGMMPIIRMTNTYFEPDPQGPGSLEEMIEGVKDGVLLGHQSIPSIGSRRLRWQINAFLGWEIKDGELGRMLKNVSLIGNTPDYFSSIDMVGNEKTWELKQIPNCGKGDPMQVISLANGGPLMRGRGRIVGGA